MTLEKSKFVYIKKWDYTDPMFAEELNGHPRPGSVYQLVHNADARVFRILFSENESISFNESDFPEGDLIPLTTENILDLQLKEEDLDNIIKWSTKEQKVSPSQTGLIRLGEAMRKQEREEIDAADRASKIMMNLWALNNLKFEIVLQLVQDLVQVELNQDPAGYLTLHPTNGKGLNIATAIRHLSEYVSDNRRDNERLGDLTCAMTSIITEFERKVGNNLVD